MKIIDLIKKACKTKGVDAKHAARIEKAFKVTKAEDVEISIDLFKDNVLPAIVEAETAAKKAGEEAAKKTAGEEALKAFREKHGLNEDGTPIKKVETPDPTTVDPTIKALIDKQNETIKGLTELVQGSVKGAATAEKTATARKLVGEAKLPEGWVARVNLDSETPMEEQVEALKEEYTSIQQGAITEKVEAGEFTPGFQQPKERSEKEWTELMNEEQDDTSNPGVVDLGI